MEQTKTDLIRQFIIENNYYTQPTRFISKLILKQNPEIFGEYNDKNIDVVRTLVRRIRHSNGNFFNEKDDLFAQRFHGWMEPEVNDYAPFIIPENIKVLGILNDIHHPYADKNNLKAAIDWLKVDGVDAILLNGDIIDCYKGSYFVKDRRNRSLFEEFNILREFIDELNSTFKCPIYYKLGNHEERIENMVLKEVPELLEFLTFEGCLKDGGKFDFDEYQLTLIKDKRIVKFTDNLSILHGHEYGMGFTNPVGVARWLYMKAKTNALCGDKHKSDSFSAKTIDKKTIKTWAIGCLCDMSPKYRPLNDWQAGFARVKREGEFFRVQDLIIENGRVL
jgi:predicted phosphodiesterase